MSEKSWAAKHPIITGALVGSIVPGIGTLAGALAGVLYDVVEKNSESEKPQDHSEHDVQLPPMSEKIPQ